MDKKTPPNETLENAYRYCQKITKAQAKNFYFAFKTLPRERLYSICAIYAFCRICDDITDEDRTPDEKQRLLSDTRKLLHQSISGSVTHPIFTALNDTISKFNIPVHYPEELIEGVETDLGHVRYQDFNDLKNYCYKVASTVGLMCVEIFGYENSAAKKYAVDLGIGMQLTNIIRDIGEDLNMGRIYIPQNEMRSFGYSESDLQAKVINEAFRKMMSFQANRARQYLQNGLRLVPLLQARSRICPTTLASVYSTILDRIETSNFEVLHQRIGMTTREQISLMVKLWTTNVLYTTHLRKE